MEETLTSKIVNALVFLLICGAIVSVGWNEPLRYRFMSSLEIAELEHPSPPPPPAPTPAWIDTRKAPTLLNGHSPSAPGGPNRPRTMLDR